MTTPIQAKIDEAEKALPTVSEGFEKNALQIAISLAKRVLKVGDKDEEAKAIEALDKNLAKAVVTT